MIRPSITFAIMAEATLSVRGSRMPRGEASLGTSLEVGYRFLFCGERWIVIFPGLVLVLLLVGVSVFAGRLRDRIDPKLR
ncbi:hypothetical protein [Jiella mangrovi]|uniref:ABC transporter permease subunit n=1 Tax=Jiella mangrovi TaxID=2821407 RepID=A0ABS4BGA6_9HYPH|nr:hypothetical protein [Jiella mangrovi]MBP0615791.1 hypothetical protein [Jiella mangrovi]